MTDKQINAAIAEACGWTEIRDNVVGKAPGETANRVMFLPNYSTSLSTRPLRESAVIIFVNVAKIFAKIATKTTALT